ncbi:hypothetical protein FHX74_000437 [Friedmanniella endophytica]|uniref:MrfA-like Zn-binding domain-containing protein n=1 Tax=Microlunatus kandeliicorticis TaxID=1759536 RepID=A0A7W3IPH8_9ACTN|nr:DUF1998 domain-containing protein [Microlunatus kandeliicorticis]MBA8792843.1 hypothetical protein [Microlunatus kandeliicorticis]
MTGSQRQPTRIGNARPSQLMTAAGIGAVADLPGMSVLVRGLEAWGAGGPVIAEPRLLAEVRAALPGKNVTSLRAAPFDPATADDPYTSVGIPVTTFPRWLRCPACNQLLPIDGVNQLQLIHRWGRRPDLAKWIHQYCAKQGNRPAARRRACIPARFVVACARGHLDEFPYVDFVHQADLSACPGPQLEIRDAGSVLGPRVSVTCTACKARRNISEAAGTRNAGNLPRCRGRHPHLQTFETCPEQLKLMVLGASNLWFGETISALHLPTADPAHTEIDENWDILSLAPEAALLHRMVAGMSNVGVLRELGADELWAMVEEERHRRADDSGSDEENGESLLDAEWQLLCHPTTIEQDDDFRAVPTPPPAAHDRLLKQVVQVERLREVQAAIGFTRVEAPSSGGPGVQRRAPLSRSHIGWVPAVERRGEGIFLELQEPAVAAWAESQQDHPDVVALRGAYRRWLINRDRQPDPDFPIQRYLLLHTLSHLLLRQVALECGYSAASIRERLYVGTPNVPTAGILLSTAASDSEGTLGGLVALANRRFLGPLLDHALRGAELCSSDPLCAEHLPAEPSDALHGAACHACLYASETSCESGNRWLHRGVLANLGTGLAIQP